LNAKLLVRMFSFSIWSKTAMMFALLQKVMCTTGVSVFAWAAKDMHPLFSLEAILGLYVDWSIK